MKVIKSLLLTILTLGFVGLGLIVGVFVALLM